MIADLATLGTLFELAKKFKDILQWKEQPKLVDNKWLFKVGLQSELKDQGFEIRWSNPASLEERKLQGLEIVYEADTKSRTRWRLVNASGQILIKQHTTQEYTKEELNKLDQLAKEPGGRTYKTGTGFRKALKRMIGR